MFGRLVTRAYLNLARIVSRKRAVDFTEVLREPKKILLHLPVGAGESWFALPALDSLRHHYRNCGLSILLPDKRETLLEEPLGEIISYGKLTPLSGPFRTLKGALKESAYDMFVDFNPREDMSSRILSLLSGARVRVGYRAKRGFPFFNCQVPAQEGNEVERNLGLLRRIGVETRERELQVNVSRENSKGAARYLRSQGLRGEETLIGLTLDPGDRKRNWSSRGVSDLLGRMDRLFQPRFLVLSPPLGRQWDMLWPSLKKEPIIPRGLSLSKIAAVLSHCHLFITGKTDLFPVAYGLRVPTILVLSEVEANSFSPPARDSLKVVEMRSQEDIPDETVCKLAMELIES